MESDSTQWTVIGSGGKGQGAVGSERNRWVVIRSVEERLKAVDSDRKR